MQPFKDDDDIDLFISPSRFSGRTPSAASTRGRVFGEMVEGAKNLNDRKNVLFPSTGNGMGNPGVPRQNTLFRNEPDSGPPSVPKGIAEQSRIRGIISTANIFAAVVGLSIIGASAWVARQQAHPGVFAFFGAELEFLQSPLYFALVLFASGASMVLFGAGIGAGALAEGLSSGYIVPDHRRLFIMYQILLFLSLIGLTFSTIAALIPLLSLRGEKRIASGTWNMMSPSLVCRYEQNNECGGLYTGSCTLSSPLTAAQAQSCPGLFCSKMCGSQSRNSIIDCSRCKRFPVGKAAACRTHEVNANRQAGCGEKLLNNARLVLYVILAVSAFGLGSIIAVTVIDLVMSIS